MVAAGSICTMGPSDLLYRLYERRLAADLRRRPSFVQAVEEVRGAHGDDATAAPMG